MARLRMTVTLRSRAELNQILVQILEENGVERWEYSLDGYEDERQCLERDGRNWIVYFAERGQKRRCKVFESHKEAAQELLKRLGRDEAQRAGLAASMQRLWHPIQILPSAKRDEMIPIVAFEDPAAATPLVSLPEDAERIERNMKIALMGAHLEKLDRGLSYGRAANKLTKLGKHKTFAEYLKQKDKRGKTKKQIQTFDFRG